MNALKVKSSLAKTVEALGDAELGRLFRGMMKYAFCEIDPELPGNERILWPNVKTDIDAQLSAFSAHSVANKANVTKRYETLRTATKNYDSYNFVEERKEEDKGEENEKEAPSSPLNPPVTPKKELKEGETEGEKKLCARARRQFVPPTLEDVRAYIRQRGSSVDPVQFYEYFTADPKNSWVDAKGQPVRNWKQKVITWEKFNLGHGNGKTRAAQDLDNTYDMMRRWADE